MTNRYAVLASDKFDQYERRDMFAVEGKERSHDVIAC